MNTITLDVILFMTTLFDPRLALVVAYYACCSSLLLFMNKVAVYYIPAPSFVLLVQLASTAIFVQVACAINIIKKDVLSWNETIKFCTVVVCVLGVIYANIKVLQHTNVETFITFRSSTPIILSVCDYVFLGRSWPGCRSWLCLVFIFAGSCGYVAFDSHFEVKAYVWLTIWYCFFVFDVVYIKHVCDTVNMTSWSRVFYTNSLACVPLVIAVPILGEVGVIATLPMTFETLFPLLISCLLAVGMSHASYVLRDLVSATFFSVIGIVCKLATVTINYFFWFSHASPWSLTCLVACVVAGALYEQAPERVSKCSPDPREVAPHISMNVEEAPCSSSVLPRGNKNIHSTS